MYLVVYLLPTLLKGELRHSLTNTKQLMTITLCVKHVFDVDYQLIAAYVELLCYYILDTICPAVNFSTVEAVTTRGYCW